MLLIVGGLVASPHALAQTQGDAFLEIPREEKPVEKPSFLFKASRAYLFSGTSLDMWSTVHALNHPTIARSPDGSFLGNYYPVEKDWARCFGERNKPAIITANLALDFGVDLLSRKLYRKGGRWKGVAVALNVLQGTNRVRAALSNMRQDASIDERIRARSGYTVGRIVWSH